MSCWPLLSSTSYPRRRTADVDGRSPKGSQHRDTARSRCGIPDLSGLFPDQGSAGREFDHGSMVLLGQRRTVRTCRSWFYLVQLEAVPCGHGRTSGWTGFRCSQRAPRNRMMILHLPEESKSAAGWRRLFKNDGRIRQSHLWNWKEVILLETLHWNRPWNLGRQAAAGG